jgi:transposase InsO family protein
MRSSETGRRRAAEVAERKRRTEDAGGNPKKSSGISGAERVREKIDCLRAEGIEKYPVDLVCRTLGIKRSSFYQRVNNPKTDKETDDETLRETMTGIFIENKEEYGRVRMRKAMREAGYPMSEGKVSRLMREANLIPKKSKKYKQTTNSKHKYQVAENILARDFEAAKPNQKWCRDSTYIYTDEGWLYAAGILDLCGRVCIGLSFSDRHTQELMLESFEQACKKYRPEPGCIFHSDRGVQYASNAYKDALKKKGMIQSMSRSGVPYDNAPMESFWSTVKVGCVYGKRFRTKKEAKKAIFQYVFGFYNTHRYHTSNGLETPIEYYERHREAA